MYKDRWYYLILYFPVSELITHGGSGILLMVPSCFHFLRNPPTAHLFVNISFPFLPPFTYNSTFLQYTEICMYILLHRLLIYSQEIQLFLIFLLKKKYTFVFFYWKAFIIINIFFTYITIFLCRSKIKCLLFYIVTIL